MKIDANDRFMERLKERRAKALQEVKDAPDRSKPKPKKPFIVRLWKLLRRPI